MSKITTIVCLPTGEKKVCKVSDSDPHLTLMNLWVLWASPFKMLYTWALTQRETEELALDHCLKLKHSYIILAKISLVVCTFNFGGPSKITPYTQNSASLQISTASVLVPPENISGPCSSWVAWRGLEWLLCSQTAKWMCLSDTLRR